ncbi:uncharacterized protein LOC109835776 [Asparagus officinalis]|uniref:uncharacterized protein LOC109835776 n=1 Tax=Asparagus officinalis TaxID=4686 RepID=UPI00098DE283|nr:uncharacterized protein LOC109835776 [Asparagus officinalis]XP_020259382.1 uncharacterized protein LOC109835776 [Asparagus officinalis]XP_020259383.1 uncharacterized protein LOC109835776 [Asparagus officinalis]
MSARPQVTITLGRSGQVVKRAGSISDVSHSDYEPSSGSKRPIRERLGNRVGDSHSYGGLTRSKRQRTEDDSHSLSDYDMEDNKKYMPNRRVGQDDLRYKLNHKKVSKRAHTDSNERNSDLREKLSRNSNGQSRRHVPESRPSGLVRQIPPTRSAEDLCHLNSLRKSYAYTSDRSRHRSPDRLVGASRGMSPPRSYNDPRHVSSMRPSDISRPENFIPKSVLDASRSDPLMSRGPIPVGTAKPIMRAPLPSGTLQKTSYMPEEPHTVASLLHSLGLGKYAILFQAEEVDMAALKQMGDNDLKELGIPMGPRKKILLAVLPRLKRHS